jgi:hypothetical protein
MDLDFIKTQMASHATAIYDMNVTITDEQARWRPNSNSWSILEVINHLCDEERFDFRVRLDMILYHPSKPWPLIDPGGWVKEREYNQRNLQDSLEKFIAERKKSITWLEGLSAIDWDTVGDTPWGGLMRAGDMLSAWVAHDLLHLRQLVELHWQYLVLSQQPYEVGYAGEW